MTRHVFVAAGDLVRAIDAARQCDGYFREKYGASDVLLNRLEQQLDNPENPARMLDEALAHKTQLAEARAVLAELEWVENSAGYHGCPACGRLVRGSRFHVNGEHAPDCRLAAALRED